MTKKWMMAVLLTVGFVGAKSYAQTDAPAPAPAPMQAEPAPRTPPTPEKMVAMMTVKLGLTPDQQAKILPIIADRQQQMQALRADTSSRPMQRQKKAKSLMESTNKQINAVLTPDQQKQFAAMEEQMKEQMKERRAEQKSGTN
jgi:protein CpxP